ncbi:putative ATP-grasp-modified RiPP [Glycomyces xiaoerkulensis]|uniref:putative ATP-grasp-modified RiPP n=1 Tax=Glycomyces xiaoerkulensis TaxID=2038139 RepID=UPI000C269695|nr:putative ATP-grasp-modified RiPP [Glycomyces xiaoerkulensis]
MEHQPWGLSRLAPYGTPSMLEGEPVRVDSATQMAVWQGAAGEVIHNAKHRQSVNHQATTTQNSTDGSKPGDTSRYTDTKSSYD